MSDNAMHRCVVDRFDQVVARHAEHLAVVTDADQWTYRRLDEIANALASRIEPATDGEPVALLMEHGAMLIASILATMKVGQPHVVLDAAEIPQCRLATYQSCGSCTLMVDAVHFDEGKRLTSEAGQLIEVNGEATGGRANWRSSLSRSPDAIASIVFTSGSTGQPKGVCHSDAMLLHRYQVYTAIANLSAEDRISLLTPCHLSASRSALWGALLNGATLFPFDLRRHGLAQLPQLVARQRITVMQCVPAVFRTLASILNDANDENSLDSLRLLRLGGESILARDVEQFRRFTHRDCKLMVAYSSTETGVAIANVLGQNTRITGQQVPLGTGVDGASVRLVDNQGQTVPAGEIGRIVVQSRYLASGYWRDAKLTLARFTSPNGDANVRIFETGDLARLNAEGQYEYCGRSDTRRKIRGHRVDLAEVEGALLGCAHIQESVVIERTDSAGQNELVAFVVADAADFPGERAIREQLQQKMPGYMVPSAFIRLDRMPRTPTGKIDRQALAQHAFNGADENAKQVGQELWRQIAAMWEQMLSKGPVGTDDDFFQDLGASSLQAASAVVKLERLSGQHVSLATLMRYRTARSLAEYFAQPPHQVSRSKVVLVQPGKSGHTPFFFVHGDVYGAGLYCPRLAKLLGEHRPFYALPPLGFDRGTSARSFPAMARQFIAEILHVQPSGPYLLGGFCNGGLLAFEIARQLERFGEEVSALILIRARLIKMRWPGVRTLVDHFGRWAGLTNDEQFDCYWSIHDRLDGVRQAAQAARRGEIRSALGWLAKSEKPSGVTHVQHGSIQHADLVMRMHRRAAQAYLPSEYRGNVHLLWPQEDRQSVLEQSVIRWRRFAPHMSVQSIPGGHHTCITDHVETLAMRMRQILDEARQ